MTAILVTCRVCGASFEPDPGAIRAGSWRVCSACDPTAAEVHRCQECNRPLRFTSRRVCARCRRVSA